MASSGPPSPAAPSKPGQYATATSPGAGWAPIAASGSGYQLYWKNANTNQFALWNLNASGEFTTGSILSRANLYAAESTLNTDLDRDNITGLPFTAGATTINGVNLGSTPLGYGIKRLNDLALPVTFNGQDASASNPGGGWAAIAAAAVGSSYSLYWKNSNTNQFARWSLDSTGSLASGDLLSKLDLFNAETGLNFDLNKDGAIGLL